ncbi:MAG TPA: histidine kinase [Vicinamibacterales bacterium]|nr:histidine kinase [Vicinamibacterales bacterium]
MHPILADRQRLVLHLVAWSLVGMMLGVFVHALLGTPWSASFAFGLPMGLATAPFSLSAWYVTRATPIRTAGAVRLVMTALGAAIVTAGLWAAVGRLWWAALQAVGFGVPSRPPGLVALLVGLGALAYLLTLTVHYVIVAFEVSAVAERHALEAQVAHRDAELRALRAQLDPHFLFNSLNSISGLIGGAPDRARVMCQLLGDFLRDSLTLGTSPRIPLAREVALAEQYLKIEQIRFGQRLDVRTEVLPPSDRVPVPPLLLQPLVENAGRHGVATRLEGGRIEIVARQAGARAVVTVTNPRDEDGGRRGTGFGLDIVRRRLRASFGDAAALAIEPTPDAYRVTVTLPIEDPRHD